MADLSKTTQLLSDALGYQVDLTPKRLTKKERLVKKVDELQKKRLKRISAGRTSGAGAGGFNRDVENIEHQIDLVKQEINDLEK